MAEAQYKAQRIPSSYSYGGVFFKFLRFGFMAFGGPVAQIAMIKEQLVDREGWVTTDQFKRLLAVLQVLPGPEAHELCVHMGVTAKGRLGGILAGLGFMLPGLMLMLALSWVYLQFDLSKPAVATAFLAVQAAVVALIARALPKIARHLLDAPFAWLVAGVAAVASFVGVHFLLTLAVAGLATILFRIGRRIIASGFMLLLMIGATLQGVGSSSGDNELTQMTAVALTQANPWLLFLAGLKAGLLTFGGAYTAIPFLRTDAVGRGWITDGQFLDGIGLSGIIPAPLIIFSTFVGYLAGGPIGALAITAGVFLPAFGFPLVFHRHLERLTEVAWLRDLLDGVAAGVIGLMAATALELFIAMLGGEQPILAVAVFVLAFTALWKARGSWSMVAVLIAAAMVGLGVSLIV